MQAKLALVLAAAWLGSGCVTAAVGSGCAPGGRSAAGQRATSPPSEAAHDCGPWIAGALALELLTIPLQEAWLERQERKGLLALRREENPGTWSPVPMPTLDWSEAESAPASRWDLELTAAASESPAGPKRR